MTLQDPDIRLFLQYANIMGDDAILTGGDGASQVKLYFAGQSAIGGTGLDGNSFILESG